MTLKLPERELAVDELLANAKAVYATIRAALMEAAQQRDEGTVKVSATEIATHHKVMAITLNLEEDIEKRLRARAGNVHGYAIDLDAARAEVGRRISRLRAAQDA